MHPQTEFLMLELFSKALEYAFGCMTSTIIIGDLTGAYYIYKTKLTRLSLNSPKKKANITLKWLHQIVMDSYPPPPSQSKNVVKSTNIPQVSGCQCVKQIKDDLYWILLSNKSWEIYWYIMWYLFKNYIDHNKSP